MPSISIATDKQLKKLKGRFNPNAFQFILISSDVHMRQPDKKKQKTNIADASALMPPNEIISQLVNGNDDLYGQHYLQYLLSERADIIAVLIKVLIEKNVDLVLVCSNDEYKDFYYLALIADFIEAEYKLKVYDFKKFVKKGYVPSYRNMKKADKILQKAVDKANHIVSYRSRNKKKKKR